MSSDASDGAPPGRPAESSDASEERKPRGNLIALAVTQVVVSGSGLLIQILLARYLGAASYGTYSFLLALIGMFAFIADLNLQVLLARDVARDHEKANALLGTGLIVVTIASTLALSLTVAYAAVADGRGWMIGVSLIAAAGLWTLAIKTVVEGVLQGLRRMQPFLIANLLGRGVYVVGTALLLYLGFDLVGVFIAQSLGPLLATLVLLRWFRRKVGPIRFESVSTTLSLVREAIPFSLNKLFVAVYGLADVLVIKAFWDDTEVGVYRVAALLVLQLPMLAVMLNRGIFPKLARAVNDPKAAGVEMQFSARILIVASVPLAVGGVMLAEPMLVWFVGDGYGRAVLPFMLLMPLLPIRFVNNLAANALSALNLQSLRTRGSLYAALVNVAANLAVVPFYGALGAAATTIVTDFLLLIYFAARLAPRIQGVRLAPTFVRLIVPTLGMAAAVWATPTWHVLLRVLAGAVVYGLGSYAFRAWQLRDLRTLRSL